MAKTGHFDHEPIPVWLPTLPLITAHTDESNLAWLASGFFVARADGNMCGSRCRGERWSRERERLMLSSSLVYTLVILHHVGAWFGEMTLGTVEDRHGVFTCIMDLFFISFFARSHLSFVWIFAHLG